MSFIQYLTEMFLTEATALTKGSQRVLADKKLVAGLADAMRDDARSHPQNFPPNSARTFQKALDEELAQWFLENIDKIEKEGYEDTIYSKDGVYSEWIVRRYIAGSHSWEDIIGVMNMNMRDWTLLKNRNMLDANHKDIPKFNSVRDLGKYLATHYHDKLEQIRDAAKNAAVNKIAKKAKIVDNEDYSIYTVFNWAAARALGLGTQWCTANSKDNHNYETYASRAMVFQVYPKNPEHVDREGKVLGKRTTGPEKYQFDAGTPCFHDIADDPASKPEIIEKFPYIYSDLVKGLKQHKSQLEILMKEMSEDPQLAGNEAGKTKVYDIDDEIKKLKKLQNLGYFTDQVRPKSGVSSAEEPAGDQPQALPAPQQPAPQGNPQMENVDKDVAAMLNSLKKYDMLTESVSPVLGMVTLGEKKKPDFLDFDKDEDKKEPMTKALKDKEKKAGPTDESDSEGGEIDESAQTGADQEVLTWMKRFASLGKMSGY